MMSTRIIEQVWNLLGGPDHPELTPAPPPEPEILIRPRKR
jgi:hypothetical protein